MIEYIIRGGSYGYGLSVCRIGYLVRVQHGSTSIGFRLIKKYK